MPFSTYQSVSDVATKHEILVVDAPFLQPVPVPVSDPFRTDLEFVLREVDYTNAEFTACECLIYPVLKEIWKPYVGNLTLRGHDLLEYDADLCGVPDYMVTRRSPLGKRVRGHPYVLMVMEAKKDNFETGWGQCLAAMLTAQKLNQEPDQAIYGIVANARIWEFGRLSGNQFTHEPDPRLLTVADVDKVFAAVNYIFIQCQHEVLRLARVA